MPFDGKVFWLTHLFHVFHFFTWFYYRIVGRVEWPDGYTHTTHRYTDRGAHTVLSSRRAQSQCATGVPSNRSEIHGKIRYSGWIPRWYRVVCIVCVTYEYDPLKNIPQCIISLVCSVYDNINGFDQVFLGIPFKYCTVGACSIGFVFKACYQNSRSSWTMWVLCSSLTFAVMVFIRYMFHAWNICRSRYGFFEGNKYFEYWAWPFFLWHASSLS